MSSRQPCYYRERCRICSPPCRISQPESAADWDILKRALHDDLVLVTNNAADFRRLYSSTELHPGLVIIVPNAVPSLQRQLFKAVLQSLEPRAELINHVIEVTVRGQAAIISEYES